MMRLKLTSLAVRLVVVNAWRAGDDKIECVGCAGFKADFILADDPFGRLADHFALIVQKEADGAGGFHRVGEAVFHGQFHDGFLADDFG